jgi:hypothetical protein
MTLGQKKRHWLATMWLSNFGDTERGQANQRDALLLDSHPTVAQMSLRQILHFGRRPPSTHTKWWRSMLKRHDIFLKRYHMLEIEILKNVPEMYKNIQIVLKIYNVLAQIKRARR